MQKAFQTFAKRILDEEYESPLQIVGVANELFRDAYASRNIRWCYALQDAVQDLTLSLEGVQLQQDVAQALTILRRQFRLLPERAWGFARAAWKIENCPC